MVVPDCFAILLNGLNARVLHVQVLLKHRDDVKLEDVLVTKDFLIAFERVKGLQVSHAASSCYA